MQNLSATLFKKWFGLGTQFKGFGCAIRLTFAMTVNIDIRGEGVRPTLTTSRMSAYLSDTGNNINNTYNDDNNNDNKNYNVIIIIIV